MTYLPVFSGLFAPKLFSAYFFKRFVTQNMGNYFEKLKKKLLSKSSEQKKMRQKNWVEIPQNSWNKPAAVYCLFQRTVLKIISRNIFVVVSQNGLFFPLAMKQGAALARSRPVKKGKTRQRVIPHLMSLKRETGSQISARTFADLNKIFFYRFSHNRFVD